MTCLHPAPKRLSAFCLAASLALAGGASLAASAWPQTEPELAPPGSQTAPVYAPVPLEGIWTAQTPQGPVIFQFSGDRYVQALGGQAAGEGYFRLLSDGRFQFLPDNGPYAGEFSESRAAFDDRMLVLTWPDGSSLLLVREQEDGKKERTAEGQGHPPMAPATPLEGRWTGAGDGVESFGFVFYGIRFEFFQNGETASSGTFELDGSRLVLHGESGGEPDSFILDFSGDRMSLVPEKASSGPPIPFVRQNP